MLRAPVVWILALTLAASAEPGGDRAPVEPKTLPAPDQPMAPAEPPVKELDGDRVQIGEIILHKKTREIRFPAVVNMAGGELLEFAIVHTQGKIHEALLATDISPTHLNLAFTLLRYPPSAELYLVVNEDGSLSSRFREEKAEVKAAARIDISVEWSRDGKKSRAFLNEWISNATTGKAMPADPWVYGGSFFYNGKFVAEDTGDIAAIFLSNSSLINFSGQDNQSDEVWLPYPKRVPPEGTKVEVVIAPHKQPAPAKP